METVDFTIIENTLAERFRELDLNPKPLTDGLSTGIRGMDVFWREVQLVEAPMNGDKETVFFGSFEGYVIIEHLLFGKVQINDRITMDGSTGEGVLQSCANTFFEVILLALKGLLDGDQVAGCEPLQLKTYTPSTGKGIEWEIFAGKTQILKDDSGSLAKRLLDNAPVGLVLDTLTGHLAQPRLHWCKLYGENFKKGLQFGCTIDGRKSPEAEAEMARKFGTPNATDGPWAFRQFLVMRPTGEVSGHTAEELKAIASERERKTSKSWLQRLFGG